MNEKKLKPIVFAEDLDQEWKNLINDLVGQTELVVENEGMAIYKSKKMKKSKKLAGVQWGILASLVEQNVKTFPPRFPYSEENDEFEAAAEKELIKAINSSPDLPNADAKILDDPMEMLLEYYGVI